MANSNSNHGRTLWDLMADNPVTALIFLILFSLFFGYVVLNLIDKKYAVNSPIFSFQPPVPTIIQDTSVKSRLDTTAKIRETNLLKKNGTKKEITITSPGKDTVKSQVVNVTSNNQLGGITANQVNIGTPPRKLDLTLTGQLLQFASDKEESIDITSALGDSEAFQFANNIKNFLLSQGYKKINGVNQALFSKPVIGQFLNRDASGIKIVIGAQPENK